MLTVESRKFCCCLPVRLGVFVLALLCMAGGSIVATVGWMSVSQLKQHPVEIMDEIALYIHASIFTLLGVLGIFGFVGSLVKSRVMVISFSVGIAIHLGLSIGSGIFTIYSVFKEAPQAAIDTCMDGKTDAETLQMCKTGMNIVKGVMVAIYVIAWLIELYAYFIVERYSTQLEEEEIARLTPILPQSVNQGPVYIGYPQRFSYSQYSRRSYQEPRRPSYDKQEMSQDPQYNGQYQHDPRHDTNYDAQPHQQQQRPHSEYAFNLPQQAYGVNRGKDAGNA
ncbi:hypothetical protein DFP72DRAFT_1003576 [Ephemerocybe angulata]|uniref:Tetraspanin n=1 Tax=Ephemerocybe angulata TaxID=980116 RepID=A0A8H6I9J6_9AGAR|nr:hypothetical protein DFP72DRAFT_1003576 [Tulosesus angulatus]